MTALKMIFHSLVAFFAVWAMVPSIVGMCPKLVELFRLLSKKTRNHESEKISYQPEVTLVIPVDNSALNLHRCIKSIQNSTYDKEKIDILLMDNMSSDNSFEIFCQCQEEYRELKMNWISSRQNKAQALNIASYNSYGKYMLCIDCDGALHPEAIYNMVHKLETNPEVQCVTGTIMIDPTIIEGARSVLKRLLCMVEYIDYCRGYIVRKSAKSEIKNAFGMTGTIYAFRRSTLLKKQFGSNENIGEDLLEAFENGELGREKIALSKDVISFVSPTGTMKGLCEQRQRVFAFQKGLGIACVIWYLLLTVLGVVNFSPSQVVLAGVMVYGIYVLSAVLLYLSTKQAFGSFENLHVYIKRKMYMVFLLPIYNLVIFWVRLVGAFQSNLVVKEKADAQSGRN